MRVNVSSLKYSSRAETKQKSRDKKIRCGVLNVKNFDKFLDLLSSQCTSEWMHAATVVHLKDERMIVRLSPYRTLSSDEQKLAALSLSSPQLFS